MFNLKSSEFKNLEFKKLVKKIVKNEYTFLEDYINSRTPILVRHNVCGKEYKTVPNNFLNGKKRCSRCVQNERKTHDEFILEVKTILGPEYTVLGNYVSRQTKVYMKHEICGTLYEATPCNIIKGKKCPHCQRLFHDSIGIQKIKKFLIENNITFRTEIWYEDCINIFPLRFDIMVEGANEGYYALIEFDGSQHFRPSFGINLADRKLSLSKQQERDSIKNIFCKDNNIPLLRISYKEIDSVESMTRCFLEEHLGIKFND